MYQKKYNLLVKKTKLKSYCKINLLLRVKKKLKNGYHSISSLITFCNLYDVISVGQIHSLNDKISFSGKFKKNINIKSNTITQALYYLRKKKLLKNKYFKINVTKNIPLGSGLGGGSSNAATLLKFFKDKMDLNLSNKALFRIANKVGSDVPIFLRKQNTFLNGKNNNIIKINKKFNLNILIVYPNINCSTEKIYKKNKIFSLKIPLIKNFEKNKNKLLKTLINENNDLEKIAIKMYPKIGSLINYIQSQKGCYFSRITGSGSACIGIFSNRSKAILANKLIKTKFPKYWCVVSKTI